MCIAHVDDALDLHCTESEKKSLGREGTMPNKGGFRARLFGRFGLKEAKAIAIDIIKGGLVAAFVAATGYWLCHKEIT